MFLKNLSCVSIQAFGGVCGRPFISISANKPLDDGHTSQMGFNFIFDVQHVDAVIMALMEAKFKAEELAKEGLVKKGE